MPKPTWRTVHDGDLTHRNNPEHSALTAAMAMHAGTSGCERLWLAVIALAIYDAMFAVTASRIGQEQREDARRWLASERFGDACHFAGLEPDFVHALIADIQPRAERSRAQKIDEHRRRVRTRYGNTAARAAA